MNYPEEIKAEQNNMVRNIQLLARDWTLNELKKGNYPTLDDFIAQFPTFNVPKLLDLIGVEMFNAKHDLPGVSQKVQGA